MSEGTIDALWQRIEQWLLDNDPDGVDPEDDPQSLLDSYLLEGASEDQLSALETALGVSLPGEVRASLLRHDGTQGVLVDGYWQLLPVREILARMQRVRQNWRDDDELHTIVRPDPGVRRFHDHPLWVVVAHDRGSGWISVDLDPAEGGQPGQLIEVRHDVEARRRIAPSLGEWLRRFVTGLDAGEYRTDGDSVRRSSR